MGEFAVQTSDFYELLSLTQKLQTSAYWVLVGKQRMAENHVVPPFPWAPGVKAEP